MREMVMPGINTPGIWMATWFRQQVSIQRTLMLTLQPVPTGFVCILIITTCIFAIAFAKALQLQPVIL